MWYHTTNVTMSNFVKRREEVRSLVFGRTVMTAKEEKKTLQEREK